MPARYNAASEIVQPMPENPVLAAALNNLGDFAEFVAKYQGALPGQVFMGGLEMGIEAALTDPVAARKVLAFIDSTKAEAGDLDGTLKNAANRAHDMQVLIDATGGISQLPPTGNDRLN